MKQTTTRVYSATIAPAFNLLSRCHEFAVFHDSAVALYAVDLTTQISNARLHHVDDFLLLAIYKGSTGLLLDCIYELIANKLPKVTLDDIFITCGISNSLFNFNYGGCCFGILNGRGAANPMDILSSLQVPFEEIEASALFDKVDGSNILLFIAKDLLIQLYRVRPHIKQMVFFYSGFSLYKSEHNFMVFRLPGDNKDYQIKLASFKRLAEIPTVPLNCPFYLVRLTDPEFCLNQERARQMLIKSVERFLTEDSCKQRDKPSRISGPLMYARFAALLQSCAASFENSLQSEILRQRLLIGSLNVGSAGLYRAEFADALERKKYLPHDQLRRIDL